MLKSEEYLPAIALLAAMQKHDKSDDLSKLWEDVNPKNFLESIQKYQESELEIKAKLNADAFNLGLNNGEIAGQAIPHVHWHIIPRYKNDTLVHWGVDEQAKDQMDEVLAKLVSL